MIVTVHRDRWFRAEFEPGTGIARVARTAEPWDDPKAGEASYRAIATHAWPRPKSELRLLFDLRAAPPRNDAVFEEVVNRLSPVMFEGWAKVVVLVQTQVGKLQVDRLNRARGAPPGPVFTDETAAMTHLLA